MSNVLLRAALEPSTVRRYDAGVRNFMEWTRACNAPECKSKGELDELVCEYLNYLYITGGSKANGQACVSGIGFAIPRMRGNLPLSALALRGWDKLRPSVAYPPLTWPLTVAIACRMAQTGFLLQAVGTLLSFHCLLRVGELTQLRKSDVAIRGDERIGIEGFGGALRLRRAKTGKNQWVTITDPDVLHLVTALLDGLADEDRVFSFSPSSFRRLLRRTCNDLGIDTPYVPHSLRHGGATQLHMRGIPIEEIMLRGRWASSKSARRYIQAGQALLLAIKVSTFIARAGKKLAQSLVRAIVCASASARSG